MSHHAIMQDGRFEKPDHLRTFELTAAEERQMWQDAADNATAKVVDDKWWNEMMEGQCALVDALPRCLSRCMENLNAACRGVQPSQDAIFTALNTLYKIAHASALKEAREEAGLE